MPTALSQSHDYLVPAPYYPATGSVAYGDAPSRIAYDTQQQMRVPTYGGAYFPTPSYGEPQNLPAHPGHMSRGLPVQQSSPYSSSFQSRNSQYGLPVARGGSGSISGNQGSQSSAEVSEFLPSTKKFSRFFIV